MTKVRVKNRFGDDCRGWYNLAQIKDMLINDGLAKRNCEVLRSGQIGGVPLDEETAVNLKAQLPKIEFSATCNGSNKRENITGLTGYMAIDIDDGNVDFDAVRNKLMLDRELNPILIFTSPRGKLKFVIRVHELEDCKLAGIEASEFHKAFFRQVVIYMVNRYGVCPDLGTGDGARLHYLSHDDNPYYDANEPYCNIPFYDIDDERVEEAYRIIASDKRGGSEIQRKWSGDFDDVLYREKLDRLRADLLIDTDGDYIYDRTHKEFIGSVSGGTATLNIDGYMGYQLKWRLNVIAMWLYGGDVDKANAFIRSAFQDAGDTSHPWNPCCGSHLSYPPCWNLALWVLKTFGFKSIHRVPATEFEFLDSFLYRDGGGDVTVAEHWDELMLEYGLPNMLNKLMGCMNKKNAVKDLTLYSFLTVMGGFALRQEVSYNEEYYGLNLILNVIGTAATGKSAMNDGIRYLLPSLNAAANSYNEAEQAYYAAAVEDYRRICRRKKNDDDDMALPPNRPPYMLNTTSNATIQALCGALRWNNGKFVLSNTEYSNITNSEKGQYGGLLSYAKNIFDNERIGIITNQGIGDGIINVVDRPNCSVMLSGTFGQFPQLYKSFEDGLLSRFIYYILPDVRPDEYKYPNQVNAGTNSTMVELEKEFLQWHFWCALHPRNRRRWRLRDEDHARFSKVMEEFVRKYCDIYCVGDAVGTAIQSYIFRFGHNVARVAALLSSLSLFERDYYFAACTKDNLHYAEAPTLYERSKNLNVFTELKEFTYSEYVEILCGRAYSDDIGEAISYNHVDEDSYIPYEYMVAALKLLMPSIIHGVRMFETYRKDNLLQNVNPRNSSPIYVAMDSCPDEFSWGEYKDELAKLRNGKMTDNKTVNRGLNRLVGEGLVEKNNKTYKKIKLIN